MHKKKFGKICRHLHVCQRLFIKINLFIKTKIEDEKKIEQLISVISKGQVTVTRW